MHTHIHSNIIENSQEVEAAQASINREVIFLTWYAHIMEYYAALENKEILSYTTIWINLRDIMLNELSLLQKEKQCVSK